MMVVVVVDAIEFGQDPDLEIDTHLTSSRPLLFSALRELARTFRACGSTFITTD